MANQTRLSPAQFPGAYSYATNKLGSKGVFKERRIYDNYIFPDYLAPNFVQTWTKDRFYGLVNNKGNTTVPNLKDLQGLRFLSDPNRMQYAIKFVADAWSDFVLRIRQEANNNRIFRNSPWANPQIAKAWVPLTEEYNLYMREEIFPTFYRKYLPMDNNHGKISGIDSFMDQFDRYYDLVVSNVGPLTLSGLIESSWASPLGSGLVIELSNDDYDNDFSKAYKYGDRNFSLVANIAAQYGFSIDKNIPWRLVADIRNKAMQEYMHGVPIFGIDVDNLPEFECEPVFGSREAPPRAYGFSQMTGLESVVRHISFYYEDGNPDPIPGYKEYQQIRGKTQEEIFDTMFRNAYVETWNNDIPVLASYIRAFYNLYVSVRPTASKFIMTPEDSNCPPSSELIRRFMINQEKFRELYSDHWILRTFYVCRQGERNQRPDKKQVTHELQQVMNFYNLSVQAQNSDPLMAAMRYMQEEFIGPADTEPLTLGTVGDTMGKREVFRDFPNTRRQG